MYLFLSKFKKNNKVFINDKKNMLYSHLLIVGSQKITSNLILVSGLVLFKLKDSCD